MKPRFEQVQVRFIQDDMEKTLWEVPFPAAEMKDEEKLFRPEVRWAEVWITERREGGMVRSGTIEHGELFLDQSAKGDHKHTRTAEQQRPSLLAPGAYKIWIDAWLRPGAPAYVSQFPFTNTDTYDISSATDRWSAAPVPHRKHWQDIVVERPKGPLPCDLRVRSRRYHWLYRLWATMDVLEGLLNDREEVAVVAARVRDFSTYLNAFLSAIQDDNTLALRVAALNDLKKPGVFAPKPPNELPNWRRINEIGDIIFDVMAESSNFVDWGAGHDAWMQVHQHLNNVAHLLWSLISCAGFQAEVGALARSMAEQHRAQIARIPGLLNRVPKAFSSLKYDPYRDVHNVVGQSVRYGEEFYRKFGRPYLEAKSSGDGTIPESHLDVKWLDSVRKYTWSMFNNLSIFMLRTPNDVSKVWAVYQKLQPNVFAIMQKEIAKFRAAGKLDAVTAMQEQWDEIAETDKFFKKITKHSELDEFRELEQELKRARGEADERLADAMKRKLPIALYAVEGFEIFTKGLVMKSAWDAYHAEYQPKRVRGNTLTDAFFKSLDACGALLKSNVFKDAVAWIAGRRGVTKEAIKLATERLDFAGKGIGCAADTYSAWVYGADIFSHEYGDKLLERYVPEDAVTSFGFHCVIWGGKWMSAIGSAIGTKTKFPVAYALQGLGSLAQFIGEFGEAMVDMGGREHMHFRRVHERLMDAHRELGVVLSHRHLDVVLYPAKSQQRVLDLERAFKWYGLDRAKYRARFNLSGEKQGAVPPDALRSIPG